MLSALVVVTALTSRPLPVLSRRALLLASASAPLAFASSAEASPVRDGMRAFADGKVEEAIKLYDSAIESNPASKPYLWQRGLALYYADRFADGVSGGH